MRSEVQILSPRLDNMSKGNFEKHYNWAQVQLYYDQGFSSRATAEYFGMSTASVTKAARRGDFRFRNKSISTSLGNKRRPPASLGTKEKLSQIASKREFGGRNYRKTFYYVRNGETIVLESSWEYQLASILDTNGIDWVRPKPLSYVDDQGKQRRYYPDFYLPGYHVYLDPKNDYLRDQDRRKIELVEQQNGIRVIDLSKDQLDIHDIMDTARE
jgi:hypothetical protein